MEKRLTAFGIAMLLLISLLNMNILAESEDDYVYDFEGETITNAYNYQNHGFNRTCAYGAIIFDVKDGIMTYNAKQSANSITKTFTEAADGTQSIDGALYRTIEIRAKISDAVKPTTNAKPYFKLYFSGTDKQTGEKYGNAEARSIAQTYECEQNGEAESFNSEDFAVYTINMAECSKWVDSNVNQVNFQMIKDGTGIVDIDYIKIIKTTEKSISVGECENGTIILEQESAYPGTRITFDVQPDPGYELSELLLNGEVISDTEFIMPNTDVVISAIFIPETLYQIEIDSEIENGTVTTDMAEAPQGKKVTILAEPQVGYELKSITVNGEVISGNTFNMPKSNVIISAVFALRLIDNNTPYDDSTTIVYHFDEDEEGFVSSDERRNPIYTTDSILVLDASTTGNHITKKFETPIDGSRYYGMKIRMKYSNGSVPTAGYDKPTFVMLYNGITQNGGESLGLSEARKSETTIASHYNEETKTYDSDGQYETLYIDLAKVSRWSDCNIESIRLDVFKNGTGKAEIDYIKLIRMPVVNAVKYNHIDDAAAVECDADTVDFVLSTPILKESVSKDNITILNELGNVVGINDVTYDSEKRTIYAKVNESIKSETIYKFRISGLCTTNKIQLADIGGAFKTAARELAAQEVEFLAEDEHVNVKVKLKNNSTQEKNALLVVTEWQGDVFKGYKALNVTVDGGQEQVETISGLSAANRLEVYVWDNANGIPKLITNEIFKNK